MRRFDVLYVAVASLHVASTLSFQHLQSRERYPITFHFALLSGIHGSLLAIETLPQIAQSNIIINSDKSQSSSFKIYIIYYLLND
jgi:hypothetical protein